MFNCCILLNPAYGKTCLQHARDEDARMLHEARERVTEEASSLPKLSAVQAVQACAKAGGSAVAITSSDQRSTGRTNVKEQQASWVSRVLQMHLQT